jgi:endonuclease/exonuclease/phosphatase family metal-dependent hydrolase
MLRVAWSPVAGAGTYEISVKSASGAAHASTVTSDDVTSQLGGLTPGTAYLIRVRATRPSDGSTKLTRYSVTTTATTAPSDAPRLLVPQGVRAETPTASTVRLSWESIVGSSGYDVEYSRSDTFKNSATKHTTKTSQTLDAPDGNTTWHLRVRATGTTKARSAWSEPATITTTLPDAPMPVRVASYNIRCHSCGGSPWSQRRGKVAATIDSVRPDVVGLQEAQQSNPHGFGISQYADLVRVLNSLGGDYAVTEPAVGASKGERIIYRPSKVTLLKHGAIRYSSQRRGATDRYVVWAKFRQRSTGLVFMFFSTHLEPKSPSVRLTQAHQMATAIKQISGKLPAVAVGDFNASQFHYYAVHRAMTAFGLVDPLGVQASSKVPSADATVEKRYRTNYDSFNNYQRTPHQGTTNPQGNGVYLDYIFTTPMKVPEFQVTMQLDSAGRFVGAIPSDHNMLTADLLLPKDPTIKPPAPID